MRFAEEYPMNREHRLSFNVPLHRYMALAEFLPQEQRTIGVIKKKLWLDDEQAAEFERKLSSTYQYVDAVSQNFKLDQSLEAMHDQELTNVIVMRELGLLSLHASLGLTGAMRCLHIVPANLDQSSVGKLAKTNLLTEPGIGNTTALEIYSLFQACDVAPEVNVPVRLGITDNGCRTVRETLQRSTMRPATVERLFGHSANRATTRAARRYLLENGCNRHHVQAVLGSFAL
jgi:hypothetical protein